MNNLLNFALYQTAWFVAVMGAAADRGWAGPLAVMVFAAFQLATSSERRADIVLVVAAAVIGFGIDTAFAQTGAIHYSAAESIRFAPAWIVALWINFALTLNHSLGYLKSNVFAAVVLGAIGGPLTYIAARGIGAVSFVTAPASLIALALVWAAVLPLLCRFAKRLSDRAPVGTSAGVVS